MGRALDLVGECNCEVLEGNPAFAVRSGQKLVGPEAELAGPLAGHEQGRGRQEGPVQFLLRPGAGRGRPRPSRPRPCMPRESPGWSPAGRREPPRGCRRRRRRGSGQPSDSLAAPISLTGSLARKWTELIAASWPAQQPGKAGLVHARRPSVGVTLAWPAIFSGLRAMAVTAWPRRASSAVMREPALPDAPMTAIFMEVSLRYAFVVSNGD